MQILLSTYNGEQYIEEQIDSIMSQSFSDFKLLIRDDGSEDNTVPYIEKCLEKYPGKIIFFTGRNIGAKASFFELLRHSDPMCLYYSFCDQDDVWLEHKILRAVSAMENEDDNLPLLYFTSTMLTDFNLEPHKIWPRYSNLRPSFNNALVDNVVVGTTAAFNNKARDVLLSRNPDYQYVIMHDWWAYLCISVFGKVLYDKEPSVLYRQHQNNLVGGDRGWLDFFRRKWRSYSTNRSSRHLYYQAKEFMTCFGDSMSAEEYNKILCFCSPRITYISRIRYMKKSGLYRHSFLENAILKFLILSGYI
ncbi:glycosyltransferase family 2 protein [Paenibacillus tritici]|nr:glycosyltransferase family 2 protein [Paenibacillus tritici]